MTAVGRGVNKHVVRLRCDAAVNGRLYIFILLFIFVEGQIIQKENEALAADGGELFQEVWQIWQLLLTDLDEAQALPMVE